MSHIAFSITYAGITLPVAKNERGEEIVPLKPIADVFGLSWTDQHKKLSGSVYLTEFLGVCMGDIPHAGDQLRNQTCILLRRVAAYLMTLNPDKIKAGGNVEGARFLIEKQNEWADALHDYEQLGVAVNLNHERVQSALRHQRAMFLRAVGTLGRTEDRAARTVVSALIGQMSGELGLPYQPELPGT